MAEHPKIKTMLAEPIMHINIGAEVNRFFDDSSISTDGKPSFAVLMGGPGSGKTTLRRQRYTSGYVVLDAVEIFLSLSRGIVYAFPETFEDPMCLIGTLVAHRAVKERRHIVTEAVGADYEATKVMVDAMHALGYQVDVVGVTCDPEEAKRRNLARSDDDISALYAERFQRDWLTVAAQAALDEKNNQMS